MDIEITKMIFEIRWQCPKCNQESYHYTEIGKDITHNRVWTFCHKCDINIEINIYPSKSPISMRTVETK